MVRDYTTTLTATSAALGAIVFDIQLKALPPFTEPPTTLTTSLGAHVCHTFRLHHLSKQKQECTVLTDAADVKFEKAFSISPGTLFSSFFMVGNGR